MLWGLWLAGRSSYRRHATAVRDDSANAFAGSITAASGRGMPGDGTARGQVPCGADESALAAAGRLVYPGPDPRLLIVGIVATAGVKHSVPPEPTALPF